MDTVVRAACVYLFLLVVFRLAGRRSMDQLSSFDLVLLLIISEATQNALLGQDYSFTNAALVITTLVGLNVALSLWKTASPRVEALVEGAPLVIVAEGRPLTDRMSKARVNEGDVLRAAREAHGLERMEQVKYAVLERSGGITVVPRDSES